MQHLQEQLQAQYSRQQQQNQQQGHQQQLMFPGMASALNDPQQAVAVQQAQQQVQFGNQNQQQWGVQQQGLGDQANALNNTAALAMMQQQQQQQQQQQMSGMGSNNMFNWAGGGGMQNNQAAGMSSAVDASSASSAQLAAFAMGMGGNMGGNVGQNMGGGGGGSKDMMATSNIQAFLQQQQQPQQHGMVGAPGMQGMGLNQQQQNMMGGQHHGGVGNANVSGGNASAQMLLQQQLAKLQRQFQGQQDNQQLGGGGGMDAHRGSETANSLLQGQQQLLQQMRQRGSTPSLQQQRGSATGVGLQQQLQQRGSAANLQQQMVQQQRQLAQQQQQQGSNVNLLSQQQQRGSSTSLHQQMNQQGNSSAQQMGQRHSALARLQQMAGPSSSHQGHDKSNSGMHRDMSNPALHRNSSSANMHHSSSQAQMHGSGSTAQLHRDVSKSQLQRNASHVSVHRNASSVGMQVQQQQGGSNQNWMAPAPAQNPLSGRSLAGMQNQVFQNQNSSGMQQSLASAFGNNSNGFNVGGSQSNGLSEQEILMQRLRQQQQQQNQQDSMLMGGHGQSSSGGMPQNLQMNFQNLQQQQQLQGGDNPGMLGGQMGQGMGAMHMGGGGSQSNSNQDNAAAQKSFLDGNFAGGWQSNADLPDRRHIIFSILEVIKQMRPDTNKISQKLPHMAKSLEEHLYRSAQTKEEYLDLSTLKKRLQMIAHGLELHRSTSTGSVGSASKQNEPMPQQPSQQQQLLQQMAGGNLSGSAAQQQLRQMASGPQGNMMGGDNEMGGNQNQNLGGVGSSMFSGMDNVAGGGGMSGGDAAKYQDPIAAQKKKVIRQQQQRLLLLRHASKCTAGPTCKTKFCAQMVTLWKHMKKCRDKNCSTSHCLSSRCVLNHYRICKSQGRTSSCEVCGPVMEQIKRQETGDEAGGVDPLTKDQEMPLLDSSMSMGGNEGVSQQQGSGDQQQLQQLQVAQMKLQNQLQVLKQLQRQQEQLLQQQRHLQEQQSHIKDPHTQQGQQLQQQQALLQQLQQRCQQQQVLLQQELAVQSNAINTAKQKQANQSVVQVPGQISGQMSGSGPSPSPANDFKQDETSLAAPAPTSSSNSNSKDSNASSSSKRGASVRRQSKGKIARTKGGKEKSLRQAEKESSGGGAKGRAAKSAADKPANNSKRRLSTGKDDLSSLPGMPEPARKMIKLEPQPKDDGEEKTDGAGRSKSDPTAGQREITVVIDDNEAKKRLVLDDLQDVDSDPTAQVSRESIEKQLESLEKPIMTPEEVTKHCLPLVQDLIDDQFGWVFRDPVDPVALGLPDYFEVVKKPMHLELVKTKLEDKEYGDLESFQKDCSLVFENSILYNGESSEVGQLALTMLSNFADKYEATVKETERKQSVLEPHSPHLQEHDAPALDRSSEDRDEEPEQKCARKNESEVTSKGRNVDSSEGSSKQGPVPGGEDQVMKEVPEDDAVNKSETGSDVVGEIMEDPSLSSSSKGTKSLGEDGLGHFGNVDTKERKLPNAAATEAPPEETKATEKFNDIGKTGFLNQNGDLQVDNAEVNAEESKAEATTKEKTQHMVKDSEEEAEGSKAEVTTEEKAEHPLADCKKTPQGAKVEAATEEKVENLVTAKKIVENSMDGNMDSEACETSVATEEQLKNPLDGYKDGEGLKEEPTTKEKLENLVTGSKDAGGLEVAAEEKDKIPAEGHIMEVDGCKAEVSTEENVQQDVVDGTIDVEGSKADADTEEKVEPLPGGKDEEETKAEATKEEKVDHSADDKEGTEAERIGHTTNEMAQDSVVDHNRDAAVAGEEAKTEGVEKLADQKILFDVSGCATETAAESKFEKDSRTSLVRAALETTPLSEKQESEQTDVAMPSSKEPPLASREASKDLALKRENDICSSPVEEFAKVTQEDPEKKNEVSAGELLISAKEMTLTPEASTMPVDQSTEEPAAAPEIATVSLEVEDTSNDHEAPTPATTTTEWDQKEGAAQGN